jgi:hypothetical protein
MLRFLPMTQLQPSMRSMLLPRGISAGGVGSQGQPEVVLYDLATHKKLAEIHPADAKESAAIRTAGHITNIAFNPAAPNQLLTACSNGLLLLWSNILQTPQARILHTYSEGIHRMVVSHNGVYVASSTSRQVLVHELRSGRQVLQHANLAKAGVEPVTVAASSDEAGAPVGKHSFWR